MGWFNWPNTINMYMNIYTLNIEVHVMDLGRGPYSSVHVLVGACLVPSAKDGLRLDPQMGLTLHKVERTPISRRRTS